MKRFMEITRFDEEPTTYRLVVSPCLIPICSNGSMDARKGIAAYPSKESWYSDQMAVTEGLVISMGPLCGKNNRMGNCPPCKEGDIIRFKQYAGQFTMLTPSYAEEKHKKWDEFVQYMNDEDVLGVIRHKYELIHPSKIYITGMSE